MKPTHLVWIKPAAPPGLTMQDNDVREGMKAYSNWPTFPQLYVKGELLGGCDIVLQMQEAGELKETIQSML